MADDASTKHEIVNPDAGDGESSGGSDGGTDAGSDTGSSADAGATTADAPYGYAGLPDGGTISLNPDPSALPADPYTGPTISTVPEGDEIPRHTHSDPYDPDPLERGDPMEQRPPEGEGDVVP